MPSNAQSQLSREEYLLHNERESKILPRSQAYEAFQTEFDIVTVDPMDFDLHNLRLEVYINLEIVYQQFRDPERPRAAYFNLNLVRDVIGATDHAKRKKDAGEDNWKDWLPKRAEVLAIGFVHELGWIPRDTQIKLDAMDQDHLYLLEFNL